MKLSEYRSKQKNKCKRLISDIKDPNAKKIGRLKKGKNTWFDTLILKKKQILKNCEKFNNENIGNIDTVGYANQEISDNDEKQSEFHPDCLENENVVFDDFSNSFRCKLKMKTLKRNVSKKYTMRFF